jgi:hypothetical protein
LAVFIGFIQGGKSETSGVQYFTRTSLYFTGTSLVLHWYFTGTSLVLQSYFTLLHSYFMILHCTSVVLQKECEVDEVALFPPWVYCTIRGNKENKKQRIDNQKRKDMHVSINVRMYADHTWEKKRNSTNNREANYIAMNSNFKRKIHAFDKS